MSSVGWSGPKSFITTSLGPRVSTMYRPTSGAVKRNRSSSPNLPIEAAVRWRALIGRG
jgi:hypothetical protein